MPLDERDPAYLWDMLDYTLIYRIARDQILALMALLEPFIPPLPPLEE